MAAAATLPCWLAIWPDLGISGAIWMASPITWILDAARDSKVTKSTSHHLPLAVASPADTAIAPARWGGSTLSTSARSSSCTSNLSVRVAGSTSTALNCGRYSTRPGYCDAHTLRNSPALEVMSGLASRISTLLRGLCCLK